MPRSYQIKNLQAKKHFKSQFIYKLVQIIQKYPSFVSWTQTQDSIQFHNTSKFQQKVLPQYFRHSNFQSFVRQLHLYNFKQNKIQKNRLIFNNPDFKLANSNQFCKIQRNKGKKQKKQLIKQLQNDEILKNIIENRILKKDQKLIFHTLFSYKYIVVQKQRKLKKKVEELNQKIKSTRNQKIKAIATLIEQQIKIQLDSIKKYSKSIDLFLKQTLSQLQNKQAVQNQLAMPKSDNNAKNGTTQLKQDLIILQKNPNQIHSQKLNKKKQKKQRDQIQDQKDQILEIQTSAKNNQLSSNNKWPTKNNQGSYVNKFYQNQIENSLQYKNSNSMIQKNQKSDQRRQNKKQKNSIFLNPSPSSIFLPLNYYKKSHDSLYFKGNHLPQEYQKPNNIQCVQQIIIQDNRVGKQYVTNVKKHKKSRQSHLINQRPSLLVQNKNQIRSSVNINVISNQEEVVHYKKRQNILITKSQQIEQTAKNQAGNQQNGQQHKLQNNPDAFNQQESQISFMND